MTHYLLLFIAAVFINNVVLSQFLGICPFLGVSKKVDTALGMGAAVTFVLALSTMCTFLLQKFVLEPFDELLRPRGRHPRHPEGIHPAGERRLCDLHRYRLHARPRGLRRYPRAACAHRAPLLDEGHPHRTHLRRYPCHGLHGLQRHGEDVRRTILSLIKPRGSSLIVNCPLLLYQA